MKENFSMSELNPVDYLKNMAKDLLIWLIQIIIIGIVYVTVFKASGLADEGNVNTYVKYFLISTVVSYVLTFGYIAYLCKTKNLEHLAKVATLGPAVVAFHIAVLLSSNFIEYIPEVGIVVNMLIWSTFGTVLLTGIAYTSGLEVVKHYYC